MYYDNLSEIVIVKEEIIGLIPSSAGYQEMGESLQEKKEQREKKGCNKGEGREYLRVIVFSEEKIPG